MVLEIHLNPQLNEYALTEVSLQVKSRLLSIINFPNECGTQRARNSSFLKFLTCDIFNI
jgi:hypothetical protein